VYTVLPDDVKNSPMIDRDDSFALMTGHDLAFLMVKTVPRMGTALSPWVCTVRGEGNRPQIFSLIHPNPHLPFARFAQLNQGIKVSVWG
jgi:hypothetical protein